MLLKVLFLVLNGMRMEKGKKDGTINLDGTIHDSDPNFSRKTKEWLKQHG